MRLPASSCDRGRPCAIHKKGPSARAPKGPLSRGLTGVSFRRIGNTLATANEINDFSETFREFGEILLIQKDLVTVIGRRTVGRRNLTALRNGQEPVVAACSPDIEKNKCDGPPSRLWRGSDLHNPRFRVAVGLGLTWDLYFSYLQRTAIRRIRIYEYTEKFTKHQTSAPIFSVRGGVFPFRPSF